MKTVVDSNGNKLFNVLDENYIRVYLSYQTNKQNYYKENQKNLSYLLEFEDLQSQI